MRCYIFVRPDSEGYGYLDGIDFSREFVICADGGYEAAESLKITPKVWLGDGDSLGEKNVIADEIVRFPAEKDNTDTDLAVELALSRGFDEIIILGGIGGRIDHEFSHFCLLKKIMDSGARGVLLNSRNEITMTNKPFTLYPSDKKYVSFFPYGGRVEGFCVKGLKYEIADACLDCAMTLTVSNCFDGADSAYISFKSGDLLVIRASD